MTFANKNPIHPWPIWLCLVLLLSQVVVCATVPLALDLLSQSEEANNSISRIPPLGGLDTNSAVNTSFNGSSVAQGNFTSTGNSSKEDLGDCMDGNALGYMASVMTELFTEDPKTYEEERNRICHEVASYVNTLRQPFSSGTWQRFSWLKGVWSLAVLSYVLTMRTLTAVSGSKLAMIVLALLISRTLRKILLAFVVTWSVIITCSLLPEIVTGLKTMLLAWTTYRLLSIMLWRLLPRRNAYEWVEPTNFSQISSRSKKVPVTINGMTHSYENEQGELVMCRLGDIDVDDLERLNPTRLRNKVPSLDSFVGAQSLNIMALKTTPYKTAKEIELREPKVEGLHVQLGRKRDYLAQVMSCYASFEAVVSNTYVVDDFVGSGRYHANNVTSWLVKHCNLVIYGVLSPAWHGVQFALNSGARKNVVPTDNSIRGGVRCVSLCDHYFDDLTLAKMGGGSVMYVLANDLPMGQYKYKEFSYSASEDGLYMDCAGAKIWSHGHRSFPGSETRLWADEWVWFSSRTRDIPAWPIALLLSRIFSGERRRFLDRWPSLLERANQGDDLYFDPHIRRYAYTFQRVSEMCMVSQDELPTQCSNMPKLALFRAYPYSQPFDEDDRNKSTYSYNPAKLSARIAGLKVDFSSAVVGGYMVRLKSVLKAHYQTKHHSSPMIPFFEVCAEHGEHRGEEAWQVAKKVRHIEQLESLKLEWDVKHWVLVYLRQWLSIANHVIWITGMVRGGWRAMRTASEMMTGFFRPAPGIQPGRHGTDEAIVRRPCGTVPRESGEDGPDGGQGQHGGAGGWQILGRESARSPGENRQVRGGFDSDSGDSEDDEHPIAGNATTGGDTDVQHTVRQEANGGSAVQLDTAGRQSDSSDINQVLRELIDCQIVHGNDLTNSGYRDLRTVIAKQLHVQSKRGFHGDVAISAVVEEISRKLARQVSTRKAQRSRTKHHDHLQTVHKKGGGKQFKESRGPDDRTNAAFAPGKIGARRVTGGIRIGKSTFSRKGDDTGGEGSSRRLAKHSQSSWSIDSS